MPELTPRLNLKKPLGNELFNLDIFNENYDLIDTNVAHVNHTHDPAEITDGFMFAEDKRKLDEITHKIVSETGELADGDLSVGGLISPMEIISYDVSKSQQVQRLEVGEKEEEVYCRLSAENEVTEHEGGTVLNEPGSEWISSITRRNTNQVKIKVKARKKFTTASGPQTKIQGVTQIWRILYKQIGTTEWVLFEEKTHTRTGENHKIPDVSYRIEGNYDLTNDFTFTLLLPLGQYEIKIVYVSEEPYNSDEDYYGPVYYDECHLTVQTWEETSDLQLATGNTSYISLREEEL